jgi:hypothetical protein
VTATPAGRALLNPTATVTDTAFRDILASALNNARLDVECFGLMSA